LAIQWTKFDEFFLLIKKLAEIGYPITNYLISKSLIAKLIDFYLEKESPSYKKGETRHEIGNKLAIPPVTNLIDTIAYLASHCSNLPYVN